MDATRFYLYHLALGVIGAVLGIGALSSIRTGGVSLPLSLMALSGVGMVIAVGYELLTTDREEFSVGRVSFAVVVVGAFLTVLGVALQHIHSP